MTVNNKVLYGIIGGSGFYDFPEAKKVETMIVETPWGNPSDHIEIVGINGIQVAFLSRHGKGHFYTPSDVPYKANIAAFKKLGVEQIFAFSAVGSLKEELKPMDFVLIDQVIDRTKMRESSFFEKGLVGHVSFADPFCLTNQELILQAAVSAELTMHTHETAVCMEGPAFSTRAESHLYRFWGAGVINMTVLPEAKLAREAGICYNTICMVTDYDCWRESEEAVTTEKVVYYLSQNTKNAQKLFQAILEKIHQRSCACHSAAQGAIMTDQTKRDQAIVDRLKFLYPEL